MRQLCKIAAIVVAVAGCHGPGEAPVLNLDAASIEGTYRLSSCTGATAVPQSPPCGVYWSVSLGTGTSYDTVHVSFQPNGVTVWTTWWSGHKSNCPSPQTCTDSVTNVGVAVDSATFSIASDSTIVVIDGKTYIGSYSISSPLRFWPRISVANQTTWKPDTIQIETFINYNVSHTFVRIP